MRNSMNSQSVHMIVALLLLQLSRLVSAHMAMSDPPPLRSKSNPYTSPGQIDYDYTSPLSASGSNFPCKGYQNDLGTPGAQSVRTYQPGSTYNLILVGSATHAGGSCQLSLSYDGGTTWEVFKSFIGGCVMPDPQSDQTFHFTIPSSTPGGQALLAWTWFNNLGNREMYMDCAVVTIGGGGGGGGGSGGGIDDSQPGGPLIDGDQGIGKRDSSLVRILKRAWGGPSLFIANIGNGCSVPEGKDVVFPSPGNVVEYGGNAANRAAPVGNCGSASYGSVHGLHGGGVRTAGQIRWAGAMAGAVAGLLGGMMI